MTTEDERAAALNEAIAAATDPDLNIAYRVRDALSFLLEWGTVDGAHHKQWTIDQAVRILAGNDDTYNRIIAAYNAYFTDEHGNEDRWEWEEGIAP